MEEKKYSIWAREREQNWFLSNEIDKHVWHLFWKLIVFKS